MKGVLVNDYGMIYRMTQRQWDKWLLQHAQGGGQTIQSFGAVALGHATHITDMTPEQARDALVNGQSDASVPSQRVVKKLEAIEYDYNGFVEGQEFGS